MIFDTHAHYDDEHFDSDQEELLSGMKAGGVGMIVDAAATVASWDKILELTEKYPFLYGSVGVLLSMSSAFAMDTAAVCI